MTQTEEAETFSTFESLLLNKGNRKSSVICYRLSAIAEILQLRACSCMCSCAEKRTLAICQKSSCVVSGIYS